MHGNPIKDAVKRGEVQYGTWVNMVRNPAIFPLLKASGLNFARIDMEHSSPSIETMFDMALLARAIDFPIVVRPPVANREWITRLLDAGVWNLHCPQVDTEEQAAAIVTEAYYAPMGARGQAGNGPANEYETELSMAERMAYTNTQVFITVMLETKAAFDQLDAIAGTPGVDALTLGPTDLAQDLGVYGTPDEGRVIDEHRQRIIEAANRYGKTTAMLVGSPEQARKWADAGVTLIAYSSEVGVLQEGYRRALSEIKGG